MHYTLEALLKGQENILEYYANAKTKWQELLDDGKAMDDLPAALEREEKAHFEKECGGMFIGREVMGWSGFGYLYSMQFGWQEDRLEIARKLEQGFAASGCSAETKDAAAKAAASYEVAEAEGHPATGEDGNEGED